ncbi:MAG: TolC family protein [Bacteroidetes bacterium]|nr:MAG: TolC family protein [Bacteroidota bacterium]
MRTTKLILTFLLLSFKTFSQQIITLDQAVAAALESNYDILLVRNDSTAAAIDKSYIYGAFIPTLNGAVSKIWYNNNQNQKLADGTTREAKNINSNSLQASLNLNWILFDGLKMFATRNRILELAQLGELNVKNQVVNTVADIVNNYYLVVRQKQQLKAIIEQMSISEERVKLAERKLSVGLGTRPELLQAKLDLNAQKAQKLQQETLISQAKDALNRLTGQQLPLTFEVADSIPLHRNLNIEDIRQNIETTNLSLLVAQKNVDISKIQLKESKGDQWPVVSFVSAYNFLRNQNKTAINPFTPLFNQNKGYNLGLSATVPILNNMIVRRNIKQAKLNIDYQTVSLARQKTVVDISVRIAYKTYQYAISALDLEEENILLAKDNVMIALERFKQGVSTFLELREAQKSLEDAYDRLIAARYNTKLSEVELLRLKGELVR